jgi:type IV secretory pathway VirB2 component (pilin)
MKNKEKNKSGKLLNLLLLLGILFLVFSPTALAVIDYNQGLTQQEQDTVDQILQPVMKIYNIIKYVASVIAVLAIVFAGVSFLTSGGDQGKRERSKMMMGYIVIGLVIIWVAPLVVSLLA